MQLIYCYIIFNNLTVTSTRHSVFTYLSLTLTRIHGSLSKLASLGLTRRSISDDMKSSYMLQIYYGLTLSTMYRLG